MGLETLEEVPEHGLGQLEHVQPLLVIPGVLDDVQLPDMAGAVGPEAVGLEVKEVEYRGGRPRLRHPTNLYLWKMCKSKLREEKLYILYSLERLSLRF
ncbi:hypothetical protein Y1Q_0016164 [Alligator mississippiensis]|uniref:Uncharacterized protein n=1 Tax=Alligator mississippiensis TaxID=8496 RepID=A0A151P1F6_ALLMI|nr:hypothetical protein Y1Q_0016164 [Alligator mississippiensis]